MRHTWSVVTAALLAIVAAGSRAGAVNLTVQTSDNGPVGHYRWLVEEDTTHPVTIGALVANSLGVSIHNSYAPVLAAGDSNDLTPITNLNPAGRYYISILVDQNYGMGATQVAAGQAAATIIVNHLPIPTAQMLVFVYEDIRPISSLPDIPAERGLANFSIRLDEILGHQVWDVFGNPLGTRYVEPLPTDGSPPTVDVLGNGIVTGPDGYALIKNLPPGNYKVSAQPQDGQRWIQTSSIAGGPFANVVVKAGEPPFFSQGNGVDVMHASVGFVRPFNDLGSGGTGTITGRCVDAHSPHPPGAAVAAGRPIKDCWVGLNKVDIGTELGKYWAPANPDGTFTISNVPAGTYQLCALDEALGNGLANRNFDVVDGQTTAVGDLVTLRFNSTLEGSVFRDDNADGMRQPGEPGIQGTRINIRYKDATIIQSTTTDVDGNYELTEVPPLGKWLIAEVDYARLRATGATFTADQGADRPPDVHTETNGLVLLEGLLTNIDQVNRADYGKKPWGPGPDNIFNTPDDENGGIVGITYYAETRAEDDPYLGVGDPWEPGIPHVRVNLYLDANHDGAIDDLNGDSVPTLADVDNFPFGWMDGGAKGPEDVDRNNNGMFDPGDAVAIVPTDGFNDPNLVPTGCAGAPQMVHGQPIQDCAETFQTWNQLRPAAFDGGYYFPSYVPGGLANVAGGSANWDAAAVPIATGVYIVEAPPPPGYEIVKEEDKNVTIGDTYAPSPQALLFPCAGDPHLVPPILSGDGATPGVYAGQTRPLCDRKQVTVTPGLNANCDFFLFTHVPKAGRIVGEVQNPFGNVTDPNNPGYGGPQTARWMPISIQDYAGHEISRVYTDEFGEFNAMAPSSYSPHVPQPSGLAPNVVTVCVNHPGPIDLGAGPVTDPQYDPNFDQPCLAVEIIQGKTTYVVLGVTAITAFASAPFDVDCELTDGTPVISQVVGGPVTTTGSTITLTSPGNVQIPNPTNPGGPPITRNYGFGSTPGRVTVGGVDLVNLVWASDGLSISADVPAGVTTGELLVQRADGRMTVMGITLTVNDPGPVLSASSYGGSIQAAIDAAPANALVLVPPGTYHENLIISKPIRLQGYGAWSTVIDAGDFYLRRSSWVTRLAALVSGQLVDLIRGQNADLRLEDGAGITVLGKAGAFTDAPRARIDGLSVIRATRGGGIFVNGHAPWLEISNVRLDGNQEMTGGGGIRLGWQSLVNDTLTGYESSFNDHISIHHNHILRNGTMGDGGGIAIFNGAHFYAITANRLCGNYALKNGGAIVHSGLSDQGLVAANDLILNDGIGDGGAFGAISEFVPAGAPPGFLTEGTGSITLDSNLIQSNYTGDGGGVGVLSANGQDVAQNPGDPSRWWRIDIVNNIITNNTSGFAGAGINLSDSVGVHIVHNTIAHNDNTAFYALAGGNATVSTPSGAGIIALPNSPALTTASGGIPFANPMELSNNIIWHNRAFRYDAAANGGQGELQPDPTSPYWDLQAYGMPEGTVLDPRDCLFSSELAGGDPHASNHIYHASNLYGNPQFGAPYQNTITVTPGVLAPTFSPLTPTGDYHIAGTSPAVGAAGTVAGNYGTLLAADYDGDARPNGAPDIGADEVPAFTPGPSDTIGPKIRDLAATPNPTGGAASVSVAGTAYDTATGGSSVVQAEWYLSTEAVPSPGTGHAIAGSFGSMQVGLSFTAAVPGAANFTVFVRAKDAFGNWGETASVVVVYSASAPADLVGPSINGLSVTPNPTNGAANVTITAVVYDSLTGNAAIDKAEYWTTTDAGAGSNPLMNAADGTFNASAEKVTITIPTGVADFFVHVRGHDAAGNWGAPATIQVRVTPGNTGTGPGKGIYIQCPGDADGDAVIDAATTSPYHYPSSARCKSLSAGDGHIVMGDGQPMFILGFSDLTGVPPDQALAHGVSAANFPAPRIVVDEDDDFYLNLTNVGMATRPDLFDPHTVHWHGFPNAAAIFDGLPDASIGIGMGSTLTYFYRVKEPGTYMYHCHQEAAEHMQMGMLGNLYVRPKQNRLPNGYCFTTHTVGACAPAATHHNPDYNVDRNQDDPEIGDKYAYDDGDGSTRYDVDYPIQIGSFDPHFHHLHEHVQPLPFAEMRDLYPMLNGRGYPDTINPASIANPDGHLSQNDSSRITATPGQKILLRISNLNVTRYYTLATLGIPMKVVGFNARLYRSPSTNNGTTPGKTLAYTTNSVTLGGGETIDVILDTAGVPNGTYFLYTTNLNYLTNNEEEFGGMMTEITVAP